METSTPTPAPSAESPISPNAAPATGKDGISADTLASVESALADTFGGVDSNDQEPAQESVGGGDDRGGGDDEQITVRQHTRRRKARDRNKGQRSQWSDDEEAERDALEHQGREDVDDADDGQEPDAQAAQQQVDPDAGDGGEATHNVPEALIHAAQRRGWSEDRIQRLIEHDEALAVDTFEQLQADANHMSQEYAALGRHVSNAGQMIPQPQQQPPSQGDAYRGMQQQQLPPQPGQQQQAQPTQQAGSLQPFAFGEDVLSPLDEGFANGIAKPIQDYLNQIGNVLNNVVAGHDRFIQERQQEVLFAQVDDFFGGLDGFNDLYGKGGRSEISEPEMIARRRVVQEADMIRAGASFQGLNMTVSEALERAHNIVTSNQQQQKARKKLTDKLKKRDSQITVPPTQRTGAPGHGPKDPIAAAEAKLAPKLRKLNAGR